MADDEDEDYFFFGTPLPEPQDLNPRQQKAAEKAGQLKNLPVWKQEVTDEQGRKRFHGAFTGGFSAGYFNSVGSKEGWAPAQFVSSRKKRAEQKAQAAEDYMDEDEREALQAQALTASSDFDTFGGTSADVARRQAEKESNGRPNAIPGPVPDELIAPVNESMGVRLLKKMGWRPGKGVGPKHEVAAAEKRREARKAMIALAQSYGADLPPHLNEATEKDEAPMEDESAEVPQTTPIFVLQPKKDFYGLGFDPLKNAPEFRAAKRAKTEGSQKGGSLFRPQAGKIGGGFGVGALEDVGEEDEDVYETELPMDQELLEEEEQEGKPKESKGKPKDSSAKLEFKQDTLPGFRIGSTEGVELQEWFEPPVIPKGFVARHVFVPEGLGFSASKTAKEVPPPKDEELRKTIESLAAFVANSGQKLEEIAKERNQGKADFGFLYGGEGKAYYEWRKSALQQEKQGVKDETGVRNQADGRSKRLTAEDRGRLLGETLLPRSEEAKSVTWAAKKAGPSREALEVPNEKPKSVLDMIAPEDRARLQGALASTFTKGAAQDMGYRDNQAPKPFAEDPAKQARYETFLQERSVGGLRRPQRNDGLTESQRLKEKEEFESIIQQGVENKAEPAPPPALAFLGDRFAPAGVPPIMELVTAMQDRAAQAVSKKFPRREVEEWRPEPLVCRRFNVLNPFAGKAPAPEKPRSKTDSLALLMPHFNQDVNPDLAPAKPPETLALPPPPKLEPFLKKGGKVEIVSPEILDAHLGSEKEPSVLGIDKPIDLFKAIFSDDEDDEESPQGLEVLGRPGEKAAEAATAALNRHAANEFLAQFGVEASPPESKVLFRPKGERKKGAELEKKQERKKVSGLLSFEEELGEEDHGFYRKRGEKSRGGSKDRKSKELNGDDRKVAVELQTEPQTEDMKKGELSEKAETHKKEEPENGAGEVLTNIISSLIKKESGAADVTGGEVDLWEAIFAQPEMQVENEAPTEVAEGRGPETEERKVEVEAILETEAPVLGPSLPGGDDALRERNGRTQNASRKVESESQSSEDQRERRKRKKERRRKRRERTEESGSSESEADRKRPKRSRKEERRRKRERRERKSK